MMSTHCAEPSPLPRCDRMTPWSNFTLAFLTILPLKKKFKVQMLVIFFSKMGQIFKMNHLKKKPKKLAVCLLPYKVLLAIAILIWSNRRGGVRAIALWLADGCSATGGCRKGVPWTLGVPWIAPLGIWIWGWAQHLARQALSSSSLLGHALVSIYRSWWTFLHS